VSFVIIDSTGIVPTNLFEDNLSSYKGGILMENGMVPPREFKPRLRYVSLNKLPIQDGMVPSSLLLSSDKAYILIYEDCTVPETVQNEVGIVPPKKL
jgi:hypothetical protein